MSLLAYIITAVSTFFAGFCWGWVFEIIRKRKQVHYDYYDYPDYRIVHYRDNSYKINRN